MDTTLTVGTRLLIALCAALLALTARAEETDVETDVPAEPEVTRYRPKWHVEARRQNTGRDTPGESTRTTLRLEYLPQGLLTLLRLDLPFPDAKPGHSGSPFDSYRGDLKVRFGFRAEPLGGLPVAPYVEFTFPTADPPWLGTGALQLTAGVKTGAVFAHSATDPAGDRSGWTVQLQQTVSIAEEPHGKRVNNTKLELALLGAWGLDYSLKGTLKPTLDWVQDGATGSVFELEGGLRFAHGWRVSLMLGRSVWGTGVPGIYGKRVQLNLGYRF